MNQKHSVQSSSTAWSFCGATLEFRNVLKIEIFFIWMIPPNSKNRNYETLLFDFDFSWIFQFLRFNWPNCRWKLFTYARWRFKSQGQDDWNCWGSFSSEGFDFSVSEIKCLKFSVGTIKNISLNCKNDQRLGRNWSIGKKNTYEFYWVKSFYFLHSSWYIWKIFKTTTANW